MSTWSYGFGPILDQSKSAMMARAYHSLDGTGSSTDMFNSGQRERKKKDRDLEVASDMTTDLVLNGNSRHSKDSTFCTKDNLLNSIAYINQELEVLGLPCLKFEGGKCVADIYFYINRLNDLLVLHHKTSAVKEDLETTNHRLSCDVNHHQSTCARLRREQNQTERELAQEKEKSRQINLKYKQICNKLKSEKEEVKRLTAILHSRDLQHKHDNKKKEREVVSLKERLHQLLADKVPDRKVGMDLMNVLSSGEGRRATWKTGKTKQEEEMYQLVISNYEERHQELMLENADLRDCLLSLQKELSTLLKRTGSLATIPSSELLGSSIHSLPSEEDFEEKSLHSRLSIMDLNEGYTQMPFDIVRKEIERAFKDTCDQISEGIKKSLMRNTGKRREFSSISKDINGSSSEREDTDRGQTSVDVSELDRLKKQICNYKDIIQQQEELIQQSLHSHSQSVETTFLHESQLLKEKENLSEQKRLFFEEKSAFEKERRAFTDSAIRLGKERQALQEERSNLLRQHIHSSSPMKENQQPKIKGEGHQPARQLPATPVPSTSSHVSSGASPAHSQIDTKDIAKASSSIPNSACPPDANYGDGDEKLSEISVLTVEPLNKGPTIHFTPSTSEATRPLPLPSSSGRTKTTANSSTKSSSASVPHAANESGFSDFGAAAGLESIRASLLRIRKSASQQGP